MPPFKSEFFMLNSQLLRYSAARIPFFPLHDTGEISDLVAVRVTTRLRKVEFRFTLHVRATGLKEKSIVKG